MSRCRGGSGGSPPRAALSVLEPQRRNRERGKRRRRGEHHCEAVPPQRARGREQAQVRDGAARLAPRLGEAARGGLRALRRELARDEAVEDVRREGAESQEKVERRDGRERAAREAAAQRGQEQRQRRGEEAEQDTLWLREPS